jgi:hypothetical protein
MIGRDIYRAEVERSTRVNAAVAAAAASAHPVGLTVRIRRLCLRPTKTYMSLGLPNSDMEVTDTRETRREVDDPEDAPCISALKSSPDRTVFTEEGNCDGWIATDLIVTLSR